LDTTFTTGVLGIADVISDITSDSNGKIIIGGRFSNFDNYSGIKKNIARLNTNGTIDTTFIIGTGPNVNVNSITFQSNGKLIIGGDFTGYNGIGRNRIARVFNNCVSPAIDTQTACDSLTWIDGLTYTSSTNTPTFTIVGGAANGCDSIVTLNLTINANSSTDIITACDSLIWIDNVTYTSSTNTPTFTLTNINGCDSVVTLNLTINNLNASYTSIDNGGGNFTFTNTSTGSFTQTHWAFGDGTTSTLANPTHTFNANGTYVVVLTINDSTTNNTCMDYYLDTLVVTGVVNPVPCAAGFVMYPDGNNNVTVVNSSTGNNLSYFWDFGDGDTSTMQFPSHTYATAGPFYLCLTVNDGVSCVDTYCDSIGINGVLFNKQTGFSINVIAPPVIVGVDEQAVLATDVTIYPNPTKDEFVVELTNFSPSTQINIISVEGKMVYSNSTINTNKLTIDASDWSKGIYVVKITSKQSSKVVKLVKQ
jgi:PKD repeat protein